MMKRKMNSVRLRNWLLAVLIALGTHYALILFISICQETSFFTLFRDRLTQPGDAVRYLDIARNGYVTNGENAMNLVFYPLFPLLMRGLSLIFRDLALSGVILSHLCYAGAVIWLFELIRLDGDERRAFFGVMLFSLYPFSMFVLGVYTESLFLFLSIGCLWAIRKRKFLPAGILGFLAALTRVQGMLLIFPAAGEILLAGRSEEKRKLQKNDAYCLLIPLGFCVYLAINALLYGNPFQFLIFEANEPWYQTTVWVGENLRIQTEVMRDAAMLSLYIYVPQIVLFFLSLGILSLGIYKKESLIYVLYGGAYLGFTYLSGWMISGGRYMLCCVPLFLILSGIKSTALRGVALLTGAMLFMVYGSAFLLGYAIM